MINNSTRKSYMKFYGLCYNVLTYCFCKKIFYHIYWFQKNSEIYLIHGLLAFNAIYSPDEYEIL